MVERHPSGSMQQYFVKTEKWIYAKSISCWYALLTIFGWLVMYMLVCKSLRTVWSRDRTISWSAWLRGFVHMWIGFFENKICAQCMMCRNHYVCQILKGRGQLGYWSIKYDSKRIPTNLFPSKQVATDAWTGHDTNSKHFNNSEEIFIRSVRDVVNVDTVIMF